MKRYVGMVTSDWSECLAPCGPFDMIVHHYPHFQARVDEIFRGYTGNAMSLADATDKISDLLPAPLSVEQMDAYLEKAFAVYSDVADLMQWCRRNDILFMINSTGAVGYFQRVFAKGLIAPPEVLAAHPMITFEQVPSDPQVILPVRQIDDKPVHSATVAQRFRISHERIIVIGDSGGDGPHFQWGAKIGATLVASMAKPSLTGYCRQHGIEIRHHWLPDTALDSHNDGISSHTIKLDQLIRMIRKILV